MDENIPHTPSSNSVQMSTTLRPLVSARHPQKYEPSNIPVKSNHINVFAFKTNKQYYPALAQPLAIPYPRMSSESHMSPTATQTK